MQQLGHVPFPALRHALSRCRGTQYRSGVVRMHVVRLRDWCVIVSLSTLYTEAVWYALPGDCSSKDYEATVQSMSGER